MSLGTVACRVSEGAEAAIGSVWAFPAYLGISAALFYTVSDDANTLILSHFANLALIFMTNASRRRDTKQERQLDELARVTPGIDEKSLEVTT